MEAFILEGRSNTPQMHICLISVNNNVRSVRSVNNNVRRERKRDAFSFLRHASSHFPGKEKVLPSYKGECEM